MYKLLKKFGLCYTNVIVPIAYKMQYWKRGLLKIEDNFCVSEVRRKIYLKHFGESDTPSIFSFKFWYITERFIWSTFQTSVLYLLHFVNFHIFLFPSLFQQKVILYCKISICECCFSFKLAKADEVDMNNNLFFYLL